MYYVILLQYSIFFMLLTAACVQGHTVRAQALPTYIHYYSYLQSPNSEAVSSQKAFCL